MNAISSYFSSSQYLAYSARLAATRIRVARVIQDGANNAMALEEGDDETDIDTEINATEAPDLEVEDEPEDDAQVSETNDDEIERRKKRNHSREYRHQSKSRLLDILG